jgi:transposase
MVYDKIFRQRVVEYILGGHTQKEASEIFQIGTTTIKRWLSSFKKYGTAGGGYTVGNRSHKKICPERLAIYMGEHPDALLKEIAKEFSCCIEAARKALARNKYTFKKRRNFTKSAMKKCARNTKHK